MIQLNICIHRVSILLRSFVPICHFITIFSMHTIWHWRNILSSRPCHPVLLSKNLYRSSIFALKDGRRKPLMFTSALPAKNCSGWLSSKTYNLKLKFCQRVSRKIFFLPTLKLADIMKARKKLFHLNERISLSQKQFWE